MNKIFILFFTTFSFACYSYAEVDRSVLLEQEVQKLTNKVEFLEHEINLLKQHITSSHQATTISTENAHTSVAVPVAHAPTVEKPVALDGNSSDKQKYDLALATLKDKKYESAKEQFADFINTSPNSSMMDRVLFWYAESFYGQKDFQSAALNYLKCYQKFPKGQKAQDALLKLAMSLSELNKKAEVCKIIKKLEQEFPNRSANAKKTANDLKVKHTCK
jgi:tol-pal system protein YbgF